MRYEECKRDIRGDAEESGRNILISQAVICAKPSQMRVAVVQTGGIDELRQCTAKLSTCQYRIRRSTAQISTCSKAMGDTALTAGRVNWIKPEKWMNSGVRAKVFLSDGMLLEQLLRDTEPCSVARVVEVEVDFSERLEKHHTCE